MSDLTIKTYKYGDISIQVKIDFEENEITILDGKRNPKQWIFSKRGLAFMQGWLNILEAMKYAVTEAGKELEAYQVEKAEERGEVLEAVFLYDLKESKKKK